MAKRVSYTSEKKAAALAQLLEGQSVSKVAADFHLPEGTVKAWRHRLQKVAPVATETAKDIGALLVDYLTESLATLRTQAVFFRDTKWLEKQNAADAAVLHGVMTDKAVRLLEALNAHGYVEPPEPPVS